MSYARQRVLLLRKIAKRGETSEGETLIVTTSCLLKRKLILLKKGIRVNLIGNTIEE